MLLNNLIGNEDGLIL